MIAFYTLLVLAVSSAVALLVVRSVINAALSLIVCLLSIAGLFILLEAEFLAVVQILVYAGGIILLLIFGIMITREQDSRPAKRQLITLILTALMTAFMWMGLEDIVMAPTVFRGQSPAGIGVSLITDYALAFEMGGLLLLISMIGAMITSRPSQRA